MRVGHRIIEINGQSVVATAHEKIVQALSNSVGEVRPCPVTLLELEPELGPSEPYVSVTDLYAPERVSKRGLGKPLTPS